MNLEESFDFTNWRVHPEQKQYFVFFYRHVEEGNYFVNLLQEHKIEFERFIEEGDHKRKYMVGVHKNDLKTAKHLNHLTIGRYRKRFMPEASLRWFVIAISVTAVTLAIIGFLKNQ